MYVVYVVYVICIFGETQVGSAGVPPIDTRSAALIRRAEARSAKT